jgi:hypothetical protein
MAISDTEKTIFLTDGTRFIGPYAPGSLEIPRGVRTLREALGATDVHRVTADTLEEARRVWASAQRKGETS